MTIPAVPLPRFGDVVRALEAEPTRGSSWTIHGGSAFFFERGAVALAAALDAARAQYPSRAPKVWLPDFICDEPLDWIRAAGFQPEYYPIAGNLEPDWGAFIDRLTAAEVHAIVIVDYFGFPNPGLAQARDLAKRPGVIVIEDAAHVLAPTSAIGQSAFVIYSPRKLFAVPSIGCLVVKNAATVHLPSDGDTRAFPWLVRRLTQKILRAAHVNWHRRWLEDTGLTPRALRKVDLLWSGTSNFARSLLGLQEKRLESIHQARRHNYVRLAEHVSNSGPVFSLLTELSDDVCPYVLPLLVPTQTERVVRELKAAGIPASRWPDLPLEVLKEPRSHQNALMLAESLVLLPVHQGLTTADLEDMGAALQRINGDQKV